MDSQLNNVKYNTPLKKCYLLENLGTRILYKLKLCITEHKQVFNELNQELFPKFSVLAKANHMSLILIERYIVLCYNRLLR